MSEDLPRPRPGRPYPLGATWDGGGVNFALCSEHATAVAGTLQWNDAFFGYRTGDPAGDVKPDDRDSAPYLPKSVVVDPTFDWQGDRPPRTAWSRAVIYEVHVKGFTRRHPEVPPELRGTYAGLAS